ncbi:MAG: hypothetical protein H6Q73_1043 [Firmicutes bacterium]|nr:hypothetical protein [Bacillota bacterium]
MKVTIIHGSPKGINSRTKQYMDYIKKHINDLLYTEFYIGRDIKIIEKDNTYFAEIIESIKNSDIVIWAFPVYYYLVPSQLKRFIELIYETNSLFAFKGKYSTSISTSANFFDHTAHNYIHAVCNDMDMNYIEGFSAEMSDLFNDQKRRNLLDFAHYFFAMSEAKRPVAKVFAALPMNSIQYLPEQKTGTKIQLNKMIILLTDATPQDINLNNMINTFTGYFNDSIEVLNLRSLNIKGGCLGCCNCFKNGKCIYKDDYEKLFYEKINQADVLIFAGAMKDRYLSSTWKTYFDRNFFNGHRPVLQNKYLGFIISGSLKYNSNLRQILQGICQIWKTPMLDIVTDEYDSNHEITRQIEEFAHILSNRLETDWERSRNFLGVGGYKIFRDFVYILKYFMKADHQYYKANGYYDFPQKKIKDRMVQFIINLVIGISSLKKKTTINFEDNLLTSYKNIVKNK